MQALTTKLATAALFALSSLVLSSACDAGVKQQKIEAKHCVKFGALINGESLISINADIKQLIGCNPDLARKLTRDLEIPVDSIQMQSFNRTGFLQSGKIDSLITPLEWNSEREKTLGSVPRPFYAVGSTEVVPNSNVITKKPDAPRKRLCISQDRRDARALAAQFGAQVRRLTGWAQAPLAVRANSYCIAVHDSTLDYAISRWRDDQAPFADALIHPPSVVWTRKSEIQTIAAVNQVTQNGQGASWLINTEQHSDNALQRTNWG